jgi:hypothetical protein
MKVVWLDKLRSITIPSNVLLTWMSTGTMPLRRKQPACGSTQERLEKKRKYKAQG